MEISVSKSSKNFITFEQAVKTYDCQKLRLLCLLHSWSSALDYNDHEINKAVTYKEMLNEFFRKVGTHLGPCERSSNSNADTEFDEYGRTLNEHFSRSKKEIHDALRDSIDTPTVMEIIQQLISKITIYMDINNENVNSLLLRDIVNYVQERKPTAKLEYFPTSDVKQSTRFLDAIRKQTIGINNQEMLPESGSERNEILPESDIQLEDQRGTMKFSNPEMLRREQTLLVEENKQEEKAGQTLEQLSKEKKEAKKKAAKEKKNPDSNNEKESSTTDGTATTNDD